MPADVTSPSTRAEAEQDQAATAEADAVAERLAHLTDRLAALDSLAPGPATNHLFGAVVRTVTTTPPAAARRVVAHPAVRARAERLRSLGARGESALEAHWAERIAGAPEPPAELARFPYLGNYRELIGLELALLRRHLTAGAPASVVVLGCGPLPLTATGYAAGLGARTVAVDRDASAVAAARAFLATLPAPADPGAPGLPEVGGPAAGGRPEVAPAPGGVVVHDDAERVPLHGHDLVVLAALVGTTTAAKAGLIRSLAARMRPGALLLARSAHGLRALLYPEIDPGTMDGFEVLDVEHPGGDVINSMIVARRV
ncbi:nicotianamine synthase family protein [Myceligenerans crystallogenes]